MSLLQIYLILNILNVIIQTIKSLVTVKCGKTIAALINGIAYGLYQIILVYAICDLPLYVKVISVGLCNLIGVFIVKFIEEKLEKTKLKINLLNIQSKILKLLKQATKTLLILY